LNSAFGRDSNRSEGHPAFVGGIYPSFSALNDAELRTPAYTVANSMKLENYKTIIYRQEEGSWVAEIPSIPGCYALMNSREAALAELTEVFNMIADEYREKGLSLPADTTEIVNA